MGAAVRLSDAPVRGDLTAPGRVDAAGGGRTRARRRGGFLPRERELVCRRGPSVRPRPFECVERPLAAAHDVLGDAYLFIT